MSHATFKTPSPYPGPRPFESDERDLFFGRAREISELVSLIVAHRLVLLYARSGAGKSSLLNAGLIPAIMAEGFQVLPVARLHGVAGQGIDESSIPNIFVFNALLSWAGPESDPASVASQAFGSFLLNVPYSSDEQGLRLPRLVIFDQFEELFSLYPGRWQERTGFFQQVADSFKLDPLLRILFVMREDYLASMDSYAHLLPDQLRNRFHLELLNARSARLAVEEPLKKVGRSFAPGVADELVQELLKVRVESASGEIVQAAGEFIEPVQLQVVCQNLWLDLPPDTQFISSSQLKTFGNVDQALKGYYERGIKTAQGKGAGEAQLRNWFEQRLITPVGTRGLVLRGKERTEGMPNAVVDQLQDLHLIHAEWRAGARWYELTHDRFIKAIQSSNAQWRTARLARLARVGLVGGLIAVVLILALVVNAYSANQVAEQQMQAAQQQALIAQQQQASALQQAQIAQQVSSALLTAVPAQVTAVTPLALPVDTSTPNPTGTPTPVPTPIGRLTLVGRTATPPPNAQATLDAQANPTLTAAAVMLFAQQTATASAQQTADADAAARSYVRATAVAAATLSAQLLSTYPVNRQVVIPCTNNVADWLRPALDARPDLRANLGCPTDVSHAGDSVGEQFERGQMLWLAESRQIYVLARAGTYAVYADTWKDGQPVGGFFKPPPNRYEPVRGFGVVWREQLGGPNAPIGWATEPETARPAEIQNYDRGLAYRTQAGIIVFTADLTWVSVTAAAK